jgi:ADP-dependent NAD(P)H-hydrate dehydratase / NAD(P)H-hydrate epimerase
MMKILPVDEIREADAYTIQNEPVTDIDLMERAATACFYWLIRNIPQGRTLKIFCGTGNNGGDGFAIARLLSARGYPVEAFLAGRMEQLSENCRINYERAVTLPGIKIKMLSERHPLPVIDPGTDSVIDAIFGSGLSRTVTGFVARVIDHINEVNAPTFSIDVPSGLFCDKTVTEVSKPSIVQADFTLTFSPPKLAFFFPENDKYTGRWQLLDIGIMEEFIDHTESKNFYTIHEDCRKILRPRNKFAHKGTFGHALLFCGSLGKMGAAVLASRGCLRSGPGLVTVHIPRSGIAILQTAVPEAMLDTDHSDDIVTEIPDLSRFSSIAIGPGIGVADQTQRMLKLLIQNSPVPLIFDADAINIIGGNKTWIPFIPKGSIFTPHPKEFERLIGKSPDDFERNKMQRDFSMKYGVYVILKGAYSAITTPEGKCYFNSTGNPGMATGGSGDVLTGILAGLRAQGYTSLETCILGVYLHGLAGDHAAESFGQEAMNAGDIVENLGSAFKSLY